MPNPDLIEDTLFISEQRSPQVIQACLRVDIDCQPESERSASFCGTLQLLELAMVSSGLLIFIKQVCEICKWVLEWYWKCRKADIAARGGPLIMSIDKFRGISRVCLWGQENVRWGGGSVVSTNIEYWWDLILGVISGCWIVLGLIKRYTVSQFGCIFVFESHHV